MEGFVVGGSLVSIKQFAHSAYLTVTSNDGVFMCGASIINQKIILTAAHCFEGLKRRSKITVRAGSANRRKGSVRYASKLAVHMNYDPNSIQNDIALLLLKKSFVFGSHIKRAIIMRWPPKSEVGYVAGWGLVNESKETGTDWLHVTEQALWTRGQCGNLLNNLPKGCICGGALYSNSYASQGDSGCALVINGSIQVGLVSFKRPDISRSIVVYTDLSYHHDWIKKTAMRLYCSQT